VRPVRFNGFWLEFARRYFPFPPNPWSAEKISVWKIFIEELSVEEASRDQFQYLPGR
jgi:hypothetical protein